MDGQLPEPQRRWYYSYNDISESTTIHGNGLVSSNLGEDFPLAYVTEYLIKKYKGVPIITFWKKISEEEFWRFNDVCRAYEIAVKSPNNRGFTLLPGGKEE